MAIENKFEHIFGSFECEEKIIEFNTQIKEVLKHLKATKENSIGKE